MIKNANKKTWWSSDIEKNGVLQPIAITKNNIIFLNKDQLESLDVSKDSQKSIKSQESIKSNNSKKEFNKESLSKSIVKTSSKWNI